MSYLLPIFCRFLTLDKFNYCLNSRKRVKTKRYLKHLKILNTINKKYKIKVKITSPHDRC